MSRLFLGLVIFVLLTAVGCSNSSDKGKVEVYTTENPNAEGVLKLDPEADIFQFNGVIYQTGIDWVEALTLTKDEQVGEIKTKKTIQIQTLKTKCRTNCLLVQKSFRLKKKKKLEDQFYS